MALSLFPRLEVNKGATFSPCRTYRYDLWRKWSDTNPPLVVIGLNPSTADERRDDPTIRRCISFARKWGKACERRIAQPDWPELARRARERDGNRCRTCNSRDRLEVHHRSYTTMNTPEELDDLTTLCRVCHQVVTALHRNPDAVVRVSLRVLDETRKGG